METGALIFWLASWTFVLGLLVWSYKRVFAAQERRARTPDPDDDMTLEQRIPPTA